jgi:hypothetical protein
MECLRPYERMRIEFADELSQPMEPIEQVATNIAEEIDNGIVERLRELANIPTMRA